MIAMFVMFGIMTIALYAMYSRKVGSFVNALSIFTALKVVIEFVFEPLGYALDLFDYSFSAMFMVYLLSFVGYASFVFGILLTKQKFNRPRRFALPSYLPVAWALLIAAWLLYAPILIEFSYLITDPRQIYEQTRNGYGFYTYGSTLLTFSAYIVFMMSTKRLAGLFYIPLIVLMVLKGAKGQFIVLAAIFVIAKVYLEGFRYSITRSATYGIIASVGMLYLFAFNYRGQIDNIFVTISGYSDYNRNAALVVSDYTFGAYRGQISSEMLWIPKIPRALWPDKPVVFGEFRLASRYYPEWFSSGTGSPSFGLGPYFADFGWLSYPIVAAIYFLSGYLLGVCLNKLVDRPNALYFTMAIYLSGNNLLAIGSGFYLVEHAVVGLLLLIVLNLVAGNTAKDRRLPARTADSFPAVS